MLFDTIDIIFLTLIFVFGCVSQLLLNRYWNFKDIMIFVVVCGYVSGLLYQVVK